MLINVTLSGYLGSVEAQLHYNARPDDIATFYQERLNGVRLEATVYFNSERVDDDVRLSDYARNDDVLENKLLRTASGDGYRRVRRLLGDADPVRRRLSFD